MIVGVFVVMSIPRLEIHRGDRRIIFFHGKTLSFEDILAVQLIERSTMVNAITGEGILIGYQINLAFNDRGKPQRICLVQCGDEMVSMRLAQQLSALIGSHIEEHYLPRKTMEAWLQQQGSHRWTGWALTIFAALSAAMWLWAGRLDATRWHWNTLDWLFVLAPVVLGALTISFHRQHVRDRDRRLRRATDDYTDGETSVASCH